MKYCNEKHHLYSIKIGVFSFPFKEELVVTTFFFQNIFYVEFFKNFSN